MTDMTVHDGHPHELHPISFINPLQDSNYRSENFTFSAGVVNFISLIFSLLVIGIVIYAMYFTFNWFAFIFSVLTTVAIFIIKPDLLDELKKNPVLQYYSLFITFSLVMALDDFKNSNSYLFLIIINMILSVISFLTQIKLFVIISIYLNIYLLSLVSTVYKNNGFSTD